MRKLAFTLALFGAIFIATLEGKEIILGETGEVLFKLAPSDRLNEVVLEGKESFADPVKFVLAGPSGSPIKGTVSFGTRRQDGRIEEVVFLKGAQDERFRADPFNFSGEYEEFVRHHAASYKNDDAQWHRTKRVRHDGIDYYVPVTFHAGANIGGLAPAPGGIPGPPGPPGPPGSADFPRSLAMLDFIQRVYYTKGPGTGDTLSIDAGHAEQWLKGEISFEELLQRTYDRSR